MGGAELCEAAAFRTVVFLEDVGEPLCELDSNWIRTGFDLGVSQEDLCKHRREAQVGLWGEPSDVRQPRSELWFSSRILGSRLPTWFRAGFDLVPIWFRSGSELKTLRGG